MQDKVFLDTNILLYCYSNDEIEKQKISLSILDTTDNLLISHQVINELSNVLFKKFKLNAHDIENVILEIDNVLTVISFNITTQIKAIRLKEKYKLQFYDALIIATAIENECTILYSEDMQHEQLIDSCLTIINPFKSSND